MFLKACNRSKWSQKWLFDKHCLLFCISFSSYTTWSCKLEGIAAAEGTPIVYCKDTTLIQNHQNHIQLPNGTALYEVPTMQQPVLGTECRQSLDVSHSRPNHSVPSCIFPPSSLPPHQTPESDTSAVSLKSLPDPNTVGMKCRRLEKFGFFKRKRNESSQVLLHHICLQQWPQSQQVCRPVTATPSTRPSTLKDCTTEGVVWRGRTGLCSLCMCMVCILL